MVFELVVCVCEFCEVCGVVFGEFVFVEVFDLFEDLFGEFVCVVVFEYVVDDFVLIFFEIVFVFLCGYCMM